VEDLVEELVGEIYDEHDRDVSSVQREPDGSIVVPGGFPLHDLEDLGLEMEVEEIAEDATTVAGLVVERLGRIPVVGDRVEVGRVGFEVLDVRRRVAERIRVRAPGPPGGPDDATR
jgi:putative hemolysin